MATNADDVAPGVTDDKEPKTPPEGQEPETGAEGEGEAEPGPIETLAQEMGWVPKAQYQGDPAQWKPADQFIKDGRDIQRGYAAELKALRQTVDTIGKTSATIIEQETNRRVDELTARYNAAVEEGDATAAFKLASEIKDLAHQPLAARNAPTAEAQTFVERNKSWFQKDPLATSLAVEICNRLASQGYDNATQLDAAEKEVRRQYPHLFGQGFNGKAPPGVNAPGQRAPAGNAGRPKGFADMPLEAQKVANDMVARGVIKAPPEEAKAAFAKNYWQNAEGKQ